MDDEDIVRELADDGYDYQEIVDHLEDLGYDDDDIREAFVNADYDWEDALIDAIEDQFIDLDDADYYADLLDVDIGDIYDMYFGYGED